MNRSNFKKLMTGNARDQMVSSRKMAMGKDPTLKTLKIPSSQPDIKKGGTEKKSTGGLVRGMGAATKGAGKGPWA
jgi:hypothetical protein|tara:strand:- start:747 stop:971 length:225 start_codon:yes stop_codon:yes gene_type:complete